MSFGYTTKCQKGRRQILWLICSLHMFTKTAVVPLLQKLEAA
jgi:hypothetical protein